MCVYLCCSLQASRQQLKNGKVTHLRVLLKSIVPACRNTSAVLKDPTGMYRKEYILLISEMWFRRFHCSTMYGTLCYIIQCESPYTSLRVSSIVLFTVPFTVFVGVICTGEILCTIHQTVMKEHHLELKHGAALILRQVYTDFYTHKFLFCDYYMRQILYLLLLLFNMTYIRMILKFCI